MSEKLVKNYTQEAIDSQVSPNSQILNQIAGYIDPAKVTSSEVQQIIDRMFRVAYGRQGDAKFPTLVGLAAPQIGISKCIVIIGINAVGGGEQPELRAFINPEITEASEEKEEGREGCFSTDRVCGVVKRAKIVTLKALDRNGKAVTQIFEGFPARVAQHEVDHLNGIRFPDRINDDSKLHWVKEEEFGDYRLHWKDWQTICPRDKWETIKGVQV
jgi:peptide deformylase